MANPKSKPDQKGLSNGATNGGSKTFFGERLSRYLPLLPLSIGVGAVGQLMMLAKYDAVPFFSWSQAINDAMMLSLPLLSMAFGIYGCRIDEKSTFKPSRGWMIGRGILSPILSVTALFLIAALFGSMTYPEGNVSIIVAISAFVIFGQIQYHLSHGMFDKEQKRVESHSIRNFIKPTAAAVFAMLTIAIIGTYLPFLYKTFYGGLYLIEGKNETKILYLNDKYIVCDGDRIIGNNDEREFKRKEPSMLLPFKIEELDWQKSSDGVGAASRKR